MQHQRACDAGCPLPHGGSRLIPSLPCPPYVAPNAAQVHARGRQLCVCARVGRARQLQGVNHYEVREVQPKDDAAGDRLVAVCVVPQRDKGKL